MKKKIFCLTLMALTFSLNAQEQPFKSFKVYGNWVLPIENFEQAFETMKQEVLANDLYVGGSIMQATDSLVDWLNRADLSVPEKEQFMLFKEHSAYFKSLGKDGEPDKFEEWHSLLPETLRNRLKENEEKIKTAQDPYFMAYALVNNKGKFLSVYFKIAPVMLAQVKEEELQAIYDVIMEKQLDVNEFVFRRATNKQVTETMEGIIGKDKSGEENWDSVINMRRQGTPFTYGVVNFFSLRKTVP